MSLLRMGDITVQRIVEHEIPVYHPSDFFDEATPEAIESYRAWLEPKALCPRTGLMIMPVQSYVVRTRHHCIVIDTCVGCQKSYAESAEWHQRLNRNWLDNLVAAGVQWCFYPTSFALPFFASLYGTLVRASHPGIDDRNFETRQQHCSARNKSNVRCRR